MKHLKIVIFVGWSSQQETRVKEARFSAQALYEKYSTRQYAQEQKVEVEMIQVDTQFMIDDSSPEIGEIHTLTTLAGNVNVTSSTDDRVGVYFVSHGVSKHFPRLLFEFLRTRGWQLACLDYVNLVACSMSRNAKAIGFNVKPEVSYTGTETLIAPVLQAFMRFGLRPQVSSYVAFVTVAFPGMDEQVAPKNLSGQGLGKKVVHHGHSYQFLRYEGGGRNLDTLNRHRHKYTWVHDDKRGYYEPTLFEDQIVLVKELPLPIQIRIPQNSNSPEHPMEVLPNARWRSNDERQSCPLCLNLFTIALWRYHCRVCGDVVCSNCSPRKAWVRNPLKDGGIELGVQNVRVCRQCLSQ